MASYPTYDPGIWNGGVTGRQLKRLYSKRAGEPLLSRPTQGQLAPGSTFKPFMTAGALAHGFSTGTRLNCSSYLQVGNRAFKNFESGAHGYIGFDQALQLSCNTFFYRVAYELWQRAGGDDAGVDADAFLADAAKAFGFGSPTGVDLPGEAAGRIADPQWKQGYYESMKDYYCELADSGEGSDFIDLFAREFCLEGYKYRAGDAVNFVIGQGDTMVTPLQLATAYGALANGGTLWEPRVAEAVMSPNGRLVRRIEPSSSGRVPFSRADLRYIDNALKGTSRTGTYAWKLDGFPLDDVQLRSKTGTAEVQGKQTTGWLATYTEDYVVVMMIEQAGTGSGSSGDAVRAVWEALYGIRGSKVKPDKALIPGTTTPDRLPAFRADGRIDPPPLSGRRR
jgi:penicillin-binding protein 2